MASFLEQDDRWVYKTRCNLCGAPIAARSYAHFFHTDDQEYRCCDKCKTKAPPIERREYWDRQYEEPDANEPLWRYIALSKFLDILVFRRLWFAQVQTFSDAFEGALGLRERRPKWLAHYRRFLFSAIKNPPSGYVNEDSDDQAAEKTEILLQQLETALAEQRKSTFVSCWHRAEHESYLMWQVYADNRQDSVCIKSSFKRLRRAVKSNICVGIVQYRDFNKEFADPNWPFLFKRAAFKQEAEVRAFARNLEHQQGHFLPCEPDELIEEIVLSPVSPKWLADLVSSMCKQYNLSAAIRISDLNQTPF